MLNKLEDVKLINTQETDSLYKEHWVKVRGGFGLSQIGDNWREIVASLYRIMRVWAFCETRSQPAVTSYKTWRQKKKSSALKQDR